jgi:hypothetical protein
MQKRLWRASHCSLKSWSTTACSCGRSAAEGSAAI